jgi:hypothetical protein
MVKSLSGTNRAGLQLQEIKLADLEKAQTNSRYQSARTLDNKVI